MFKDEREHKTNYAKANQWTTGSPIIKFNMRTAVIMLQMYVNENFSVIIIFQKTKVCLLY